MRGVVYIGVGVKYLKAALLSMITLRQTNPDLPVHLLTPFAGLKELPVSLATVQTINFPGTHSQCSRRIKLRLDELSPFEETLYLDSDTLVLDDVSGVWGETPAFHIDKMPTVSECRHATKEEKSYTLSVLPAKAPHYNGGVFVFTKTTNLFAAWRAEWDRFQHIDQLALARATYLTGTKIHPLPSKYNSYNSVAGAAIAHFLGDYDPLSKFNEAAAATCPSAVKEYSRLYEPDLSQRLVPLL